MPKTTHHPNECNPLGILALTGWPDGLDVYVQPGEIRRIERLSAYIAHDGEHRSERTVIRCPDKLVLVNETPREIFWKKDALDRMAKTQADAERESDD